MKKFLLFALVFLQTLFLFGQNDKISINTNINYADKLVSKKVSTILYKTTFSFTDVNGNSHQIPESYYSPTGQKDGFSPSLYFDGKSYYYLISCMDNGSKVYCYKYNKEIGFLKEVIYDGSHLIINPFFGKIINNEPVVYFYEPNGTHQTVMCNRNNGIWENSISNLSLEDFVSVIKIIKPVQTIEEAYKQYPFKHYKTGRNYDEPVFCNGDDISMAKETPKIIYNEVANTKVEVKNMPRIQAQSELGECKIFALAAVIQKYICDKYWQIDDCATCKGDYAISYFGLMPVVWVNDKGEFDFERENELSEIDILTNLKRLNNGVYYIDHCKPFYKISEALGGSNGIQKSKEFELFLKNSFLKFTNKQTSNKEVESLLVQMENFTGMEKKYFNFPKALKETTFSLFVKSLFFDGCPTAELPYSFLPYYITNFPNQEYENVIDTKTMILAIRDGLNRQKPVLIKNLYAVKNIDGSVKEDPDLNPHVLLVTGYKQVYNPANPNEKKELFKLHNSYGIKWQQERNNGWVDAETLIESIGMYWDSNKKYLRPFNNVTIWIR